MNPINLGNDCIECSPDDLDADSVVDTDNLSIRPHTGNALLEDKEPNLEHSMTKSNANVYENSKRFYKPNADLSTNPYPNNYPSQDIGRVSFPDQDVNSYNGVNRKDFHNTSSDMNIGFKTAQDEDSMLELQKSFVKQTTMNETRKLYKFCGLVNLGNTCYANSCLQILYNLRRVRKNFIERKSTGLFHQLIGSLFENMLLVNQNKTTSEKYGYYEPNEFMKEFRKKRVEFIHDEQHDAQEFMTVLLDILHQETNKVDNNKKEMSESKNQLESWNSYVRFIDNSHLSRNFLGQAESIVTCQICRNNSLSWYCFWQLTLHISDHTLTLDDCFKEFRDVETLEEDSSPICTKCNKKQPSTKTQYICRSPHYLFCHLKRFTYDGQKIYSKIEIPDGIVVGNKQYKFQGAVLHSGFMQAGHYTAIISINDELFLHDDDDVIQMNEQNESYMRRKLDYDAYMVFYKSVGSVSLNNSA